MSSQKYYLKKYNSKKIKIKFIEFFSNRNNFFLNRKVPDKIIQVNTSLKKTDLPQKMEQ